MKFSSVAALNVVILTTSSAANNAPKRVGVRGPRGELSPQPEYLRGEF